MKRRAMNRIFQLLSVVALFALAAGASAQQPVRVQVQPGAPATADRTIRLKGQAPDPTYGYSQRNPILLGGMAERDFDKRVETYFSLLFSADAQPLKVVLNETCCQFRTSDGVQTLQVIEAGQDGKRPFRFYVNGFQAGPLYAPRGLLAVRSEANAETLQGALDNLRAGFTDGAVQELRPIAEAGDVMAQYQLGRILADKRDFAGAYSWFLKAAQGGHSVSQAAVAGMLEAGNGIAADKAAAQRWLHAAAASGHTGALMTLALRTLSGKPDAAAFTRAASMLQLAAELGDPAAQAAYGIMLVQGRGVPQNNFLGLMWLFLAKRAGDENAGAAYARLSSGQTAQTIARIEQTADQWSKARAPAPVTAEK
jgi:hypothetical protein